jgi:hypothetical protein
MKEEIETDNGNNVSKRKFLSFLNRNASKIEGAPKENYKAETENIDHLTQG